MADFRNNPNMSGEDGGQIKRYVHQPLHTDHYGIHCEIKENGKVVITSAPDSSGEFDEVEIPASLVFKLATLLKATRNVHYVTVQPEKPAETK